MNRIFAATLVLSFSMAPMLAGSASAAPAPGFPSGNAAVATVEHDRLIQEARLDIRWHSPTGGRKYVCVRHNGRSTCSVER
ncbi:MAG: hypothetical protein ACRCTI_05865 [Beijerinckiaceae bacterium]